LEKTRNTEEEKKMGQKWVKEEHKASTSRVNTGFPVNTGKLSPMMKEYVKTKEEYSDCILFYRLGDFYEMFFDDALTASKELEITLTGKDCGLEERAPMCGVPFHAAETYINRLIEKGYKVAICEQVEDPKKAKGLVKREVVRIVTPLSPAEIILAVLLQISQPVTAFLQSWISLRNFWMRSINSHLQRSSATMRFF